MRYSTAAAALLAACALLPTRARAITIAFDYTYDTTGFFADPTRKDTLNLAASAFTGFTDTLSAITPSGTNTWSTTFPNPVTGLTTSLVNPSIPANTLTVYVGARDLPGSTLGQGGPGGFGGSGNASWVSTISTRGQVGATTDPLTSTDFGPWGGAISFDSLTSWFFGPTTAGLSGSQSDFLSVATHELAHLLGFGTAKSFTHYVSGTNFIGPTAESKFGNSPVPLSTPDLAHWANGTTSTIGGDVVQETAMDPSLTVGTRKYFTLLDYAGLKDVGWQVPSNLLIAPAHIGDTSPYNGVIDLADLNNVLNNFGTSNSQGFAWPKQSGTVDLTDLNAVLNNFGAGGAEPSALIAVPEPASLSLLAVAAGLTLRRRR